MAAVPGLETFSPPIVAILRGVQPREAADVGGALIDAGIRIVEVPLNSPQALQSIERLAAAIGDGALVGAGTVLDTAAVDDVVRAGARFIVAPNTDPRVVARALERELEAMPGALTPTEAFAALSAGARHLKLFPAASAGPGHLRALAEVLPADCRVWAVGGVNIDNLGEWRSAGAFGIAAGGALYKPGRAPDDIYKRAEALVTGWRSFRGE